MTQEEREGGREQDVWHRGALLAASMAGVALLSFQAGTHQRPETVQADPSIEATEYLDTAASIEHALNSPAHDRTAEVTIFVNDVCNRYPSGAIKLDEHH